MDKGPYPGKTRHTGMKQVDIDPQSGFCAGVIRAISRAEKFLEPGGRRLYSLGAIVHNEAELHRLAEKGLFTLDRDDINEINEAQGETILIRAHGQPPKVYDLVKSLGFDIIDCTCPVVLNLQKSIKNTYAALQSSGKGGKVLIFGKVGHAEVLGLIGQVDGDAVVFEDRLQLEELVENGTVSLSRDIELFSQTTMSPVDYEEIQVWLRDGMKDGARLSVHNTICSQVAARHDLLVSFARKHDVIIFVSGKTSSNGKVLCALCKSANIRTYHISSIQEIQPVWFREEDTVGVCGATSTPRWLLEETAKAIEAL